MSNISNSISKYQYQTYADKINEYQKFKLKLYIMPKSKVKQMKFTNEYKSKPNLNNEDGPKVKENSNEIKTLKKNLIDKITKKFNRKHSFKKEKAPENSGDVIHLQITEENMPEGEKNVINSTIIRNSLILDTNLYYCRYLKQVLNNPNSRMEATFTPYYNTLFLFGGLQTNNQSDLWELDINDKTYTWKKRIIKEELNPRFGHIIQQFYSMIVCIYMVENLI